MAAVSIEELRIADDPERWAALGFAVDGACCQIGRVTLRFEAAESAHGILGWSLRGARSVELDGLPTTIAGGEAPPPAPAHPNEVVAIDHVVAMTPALDRSVGALERAGLDLRRIREQPTPAGAPRQAFFRLGEAIVEVVQEPQAVASADLDGPARFWGLALLVRDIDAAVARLAPHVSGPREAVQQGRRIATLKRSAGVSLPLALMSAVEERVGA